MDPEAARAVPSTRPSCQLGGTRRAEQGFLTVGGETSARCSGEVPDLRPPQPHDIGVPPRTPLNVPCDSYLMLVTNDGGAPHITRLPRAMRVHKIGSARNRKHGHRGVRPTPSGSRGVADAATIISSGGGAGHDQHGRAGCEGRSTDRGSSGPGMRSASEWRIRRVRLRGWLVRTTWPWPCFGVRDRIGRWASGES